MNVFNPKTSFVLGCMFQLGVVSKYISLLICFLNFVFHPWTWILIYAYTSESCFPQKQDNGVHFYQSPLPILRFVMLSQWAVVSIGLRLRVKYPINQEYKKAIIWWIHNNRISGFFSFAYGVQTSIIGISDDPCSKSHRSKWVWTCFLFLRSKLQCIVVKTHHIWFKMVR